MKKFLVFLIATVLLVMASAVVVSASFVQNDMAFELQPQNCTFPENSTASYTVKAKGNYLRAFWYLEWQGKKYDLTDNTNPTEPWEAYAGESYGATSPDANTFTFFFGGIGKELDGAYIWCVIDDGHFDMESQKVRITVSDEKAPPENTDPITETKVETPVQTDPEIKTDNGGETLPTASPETDKEPVGGEEKSFSVNGTIVVMGVVIAVLCLFVGVLAGMLFAKKK